METSTLDRAPKVLAASVPLIVAEFALFLNQEAVGIDILDARVALETLESSLAAITECFPIMAEFTEAGSSEEVHEAQKRQRSHHARPDVDCHCVGVHSEAGENQRTRARERSSCENEYF